MKNPFIIALDVATTTGVCEGRVGDDAAPSFYTLKLGREHDDHEDSFARALRWIAERLTVSKPDAIYIEAPINPAAFLGKYDAETGRMGMTTNPDTTIRLIGLWATMAAAAKVKGVMYRRAAVGTVRKAFIGHGNLKGAEAKRRCFAMCNMLDWSPNNRDESDAGAVWYWAATQLDPNNAPIVTPMMQAKCATTIGGVDVGDDLFVRSRKAVRR